MRSTVLARFGFGWAVAYIPIHLYWALGGSSTDIGIDTSDASVRTANWGATVVILGAGLTCLSLAQQWGRLLPRALRSGAALIGGGFAVLHWVVFTVASSLRLGGVIGYPTDGDATPAQLRHFDWWNIGYFELWFGVMGLVLILCALRTRASEPVVVSSWPRTAGTALTLAGVATVIWGVFTFNAWIFGIAGPITVAAGVLVLLASQRGGRRVRQLVTGGAT